MDNKNNLIFYCCFGAGCFERTGAAATRLVRVLNGGSGLGVTILNLVVGCSAGLNKGATGVVWCVLMYCCGHE